MKTKQSAKSKNGVTPEIPRKKDGLLELIQSLPKRKIPKGDLIKIYYEERGKKYGYASSHRNS